MVDSSSSVQQNNWKKMIMFLINIVGYLDISQDNIHVAFVQFGTTSSIMFGLDKYYSIKDAQQAIRDIPYLSEPQLTNIAAAIHDAYNILKMVPPARDDVQQIMILLTDGVPTVSAFINLEYLPKCPEWQG